MNYIYKCPCGYTYNENISKCINCNRNKSEFVKGYFISETDDVDLDFSLDELMSQQVFIGLQDSNGNIITNLETIDSNIKNNIKLIVDPSTATWVNCVLNAAMSNIEQSYVCFNISCNDAEYERNATIYIKYNDVQCDQCINVRQFDDAPDEEMYITVTNLNPEILEVFGIYITDTRIDLSDADYNTTFAKMEMILDYDNVTYHQTMYIIYITNGKKVVANSSEHPSQLVNVLVNEEICIYMYIKNNQTDEIQLKNWGTLRVYKDANKTITISL